MGKEIQRAEAFVREWAETYGDVLVSAVLYGSAARGDFQEGVSDVNLLLLMRDADANTLRKGSALARRWVEEGNPPPLLWGEEEWKRSADVFPIEIADIRDAHLVLHGTDPFEGVKIDVKHLRLQCEHELKAKQIQLRERYLLSADDTEALAQLLIRSFPTFLVLFRTVLRIEGASVARDPEAAIRAVAERVGFDPAPLVEVLRLRRGTRTDVDDPIVNGYLDVVARTAEYVDRLHAPGT